MKRRYAYGSCKYGSECGLVLDCECDCCIEVHPCECESEDDRDADDFALDDLGEPESPVARPQGRTGK